MGYVRCQTRLAMSQKFHVFCTLTSKNEQQKQQQQQQQEAESNLTVKFKIIS